MILLIDNYDTRMNELYKYISEEYADVQIVRNDEISAERLAGMNPEAVIINSSDCSMERAGICAEAARIFCTNVPVLGIGLGAQAVCEAFGGRTECVKLPDNRTFNIGFDTSSGVFMGSASLIGCDEAITRSVNAAALPECLRLTARDEYGRGLAFAHADLPVYGIFFTPYDLKNDAGRDIIKNFIRLI